MNTGCKNAIFDRKYLKNNENSKIQKNLFNRFIIVLNVFQRKNLEKKLYLKITVGLSFFARNSEKW